MSQEGYQKGQIVAGFAGEDTNHLPFSIPMNIAAYGLNNDYYRGTILKRAGMKRLDDRAMGQGSISIRTDNTTFDGSNGIGKTTFAPAAAWAISFAVRVDKSNCIGSPKLLCCGTPATDGFNIYYDKTNDRFVAEIESSTGTQVLQQASGSYTDRTVVSLMLVYYVGQNGHKYHRFYQNGTLVENNTLLSNYVAPASPKLYFSNNGATNQTVKFWMGELRLWELANSSDAAYSSWLTYWTTDLSYRRTLTDAERADSRLKGYFDFSIDSYNYSNGFSNLAGTLKFVMPIPSGGIGIGTREIAAGHALVAQKYDSAWPNCTAVILWPSDFGECWARFGSEIWVHVNQTSVTPSYYATRACEFENFTSGTPIKEGWSVCRYRGFLVATHPHVAAVYMGQLTGSPSQFAALVPSTLDALPTAADKGSGSGPGAGTYNFKFFYYNSTTGVHSPPYQTIVSVTMVGANAIQIGNLSSIANLRRPLDGVDMLRIFRTKNGGGTYYLVDDITLSSSPSSTYSGVGINQSDSALIEANSEQALRYDMADRQPFRARAAFEHQGYLMLVAPNEQVEYGIEIDFRDTYNNAIMWSEPSATHLFEDGNYRDILPDVSDFLTGGISVAGGALLCKRYSLVGLYGDNPSTWVPRHISHAHGCISHNSIAAGDQFIYLLSDRAIVRVPVSLSAGSAEDVTSDRYKPLFDDIDATKIGRACGAYHKTKRQYWVSFDTISSGRVTVVFSERTGAIALYDLAIEAFCQFQANDPDASENKLVGSWRGYLVELDSGTNDGADVESFTEILTGTVTSGDAQSLSDSVRSWTTASHYGAVANADVFSILAGLRITVQRASDYAKQTRTIVYNTGTRIWVDSAWDWAPAAGDTYFIAGIAWEWRSKKFSAEGDPGEDSLILRVGFWQKKQDVAKNVNVYGYADDTLLSPASDWLVSTDLRYQEIAVSARAREFELRLTNLLADQPVEIEAIQVHFEEAGSK